MVNFVIYILPQLKNLKSQKQNKTKQLLLQFMLFSLYSITVSQKKPGSILCILPRNFLRHIHKFIGLQVTVLPNFPTIMYQRLLFLLSPVSFLHCPLRLTNIFPLLLTISLRPFQLLPLPGPKASAIRFRLLLCKQPPAGHQVLFWSSIVWRK